MKNKLVLLLLIMLIAFCNTKGQLKMTSDGSVDIKNTPDPQTYRKLGIELSSEEHTTVSGVPTNFGLHSSNISINPSINAVANIGTFSTAYISSPQSWGWSIGLWGVGGNATNGYNCGVEGSLGGSQYGAGIVGRASGFSFPNITGNYAGFFYGNVKITNPSNNATLWVNSTSYTSDKRLKKNIEALSNTYDKLLKLNAVKYNYKTQNELEADGLIAKSDTAKYNDNSNIINKDKLHYGYIAQELKELFPELVYEGDDGFLGVDYIGLIPLMIEAIKEQNTIITGLQESINKCCGEENLKKASVESKAGNNSDVSVNKAVLYQNAPNPFSKETEIKCFIPKTSVNAAIYIYNMQGTQIKKLQINNRENTSISIQGSELKAGMYMYSLIIDSKEIDTKRMILTE